VSRGQRNGCSTAVNLVKTDNKKGNAVSLEGLIEICNTIFQNRHYDVRLHEKVTSVIIPSEIIDVDVPKYMYTSKFTLSRLEDMLEVGL
jgi:hypothetical protein